MCQDVTAKRMLITDNIFRLLRRPGAFVHAMICIPDGGESRQKKRSRKAIFRDGLCTELNAAINQMKTCCSIPSYGPEELSAKC